MVVLFFLALILFYIYPLFIQPFYSACLHSSTKITKLGLDDLRNYYIIIGTISGTVTALIGVILGFFYYFHKARVDKQLLQDNKRTRILELLLSEISDYDVLVDKILNKEFKSHTELQILRGKIQRKFEMVYQLVDEKNGILNFSKNSKIDLFEVNKFVDKSQLIMEKNYDEITSGELNECRQEYVERLIQSRRVCLRA